MEEDKKHVITQWMEGEISNYIKVWLSAYISLSYCYMAAKIFPKGPRRLAAMLPNISLFFLLPLKLHSLHLGGTTAFFLPWIANFKLLMFAFGQGPLSSPSISLLKFVAIACLPIRLHRHNSAKSQPKSIISYAIKAVMLAVVIKGYDYAEHIHPRFILVLYSLHVYFALEIILAIAAAMARVLIDAEIEPQFDEPYLSTSLQDFWGRRWNLMVTRILRPTVYLPVVSWSSGLVGRKWAPLPAVMATFVVSGLMHELIFFYLGRVYPTWEITRFFLLHGACLMLEIVVKKAVNGGRWRLPRIVATFMTIGFVMGTGFWLFFPQLLRCKAGERGVAEVAAVGEFGNDVARAFKVSVHSYTSFS